MRRSWTRTRCGQKRDRGGVWRQEHNDNWGVTRLGDEGVPLPPRQNEYGDPC